MNLEISEEADADLTAIFAYGAEQFGEDVAAAYLRGFADALALIGAHPRIGALHATVRPPLRSLPHGAHRLYYDVLDDCVIVQRVLHKAMDVERWL